MTDSASDSSVGSGAGGAPSVVYWWDFFGPNAERTARHHATHLLEFLAGKGYVASEVGAASKGHGHFAAYCIAELAAQPLVLSTLRPNRVTPVSEVPC